MQLQAKGSPAPRHHGLTHAAPLRHHARRPVRRSHRLAVQCQRDHRLDGLVAKLPRCPSTGSIEKPFQPVRQEALPSGDDALAAHTEPLGNCHVGGVRCGIGRQYNTCSHDRGLAETASTHQALQRLAFLCRQNQCRRFRLTCMTASYQRQPVLLCRILNENL
jgi:hypothetical protein